MSLTHSPPSLPLPHSPLSLPLFSSSLPPSPPSLPPSLPPPLPPSPPPSGQWLCKLCTSCASCGSLTPGPDKQGEGTSPASWQYEVNNNNLYLLHTYVCHYSPLSIPKGNSCRHCALTAPGTYMPLYTCHM